MYRFNIYTSGIEFDGSFSTVHYCREETNKLRLFGWSISFWSSIGFIFLCVAVQVRVIQWPECHCLVLVLIFKAFGIEASWYAGHEENVPRDWCCVLCVCWSGRCHVAGPAPSTCPPGMWWVGESVLGLSHSSSNSGSGRKNTKAFDHRTLGKVPVLLMEPFWISSAAFWYLCTCNTTRRLS